MIDVGWLAEMGPCLKFKSGQHIPCPYVSESSERAMYILIAGRVDVYNLAAGGVVAPVGTLNPGGVFGGSEFFSGVPERVYTAVSDSIVYLLSENSFDELSWAQPQILFEVLKAAYMPFDAAVSLPEEKTKEPQKAETEKAGSEKTKEPQIAESEKAGSEKAGSEQSGNPEELTDYFALFSAGYSIYPEGHKPCPGVVMPEYAHLVYNKDYVCPFCKKKFKGHKIFHSKLYESAPMRFDLRKYYTDFKTEWYDVVSCPHCYFSTLQSYFAEPKPLQSAKIDESLTAARETVLLDFEAERDLDFVFATHYLADLCAGGYRSHSNLIRSKLWGNLSWLYEDAGNEEMMIFAADKAAAAYEAVYSETRLPPQKEQMVCLSISGMQYRAGVDRGLKKCLFTAMTMKNGDKVYAKLAEDFLYDLRTAEEAGNGETKGES